MGDWKPETKRKNEWINNSNYLLITLECVNTVFIQRISVFKKASTKKYKHLNENVL